MAQKEIVSIWIWDEFGLLARAESSVYLGLKGCLVSARVNSTIL